jgi:hypothetical protein
MRALIVYESIYGNTHEVATRIAAGLAPHVQAQVVAIRDATQDLVGRADVVIVGGPTHAHDLSSTSSRKGARESAEKPGSELDLDPDATGPGLRDSLRTLAAAHGRSAMAFDTRLDASDMLTGRASNAIARRLRSHGFSIVAEPESFLVNKKNQLRDGEVDRATAWGARLAETLTAAP